MENNLFEKILTIDKSLPAPLYQQMVECILKAIEQNILKQGDICPSINQLSQRYNVSRATVEKAFFILRQMGVVSAFHGKCYFISNDPDKHAFSETIMFKSLYG